MRTMQISNFVLDTSSAIKPILQEEGWKKVARIFNLKDNRRISLLMPEIFRYELLNTIGRLKGKRAAIEAYDAITLTQVSIIPLHHDIQILALGIVEKYKQASFYDAVFHALAILYKSDFVTSDRKYYNLTKNEGNIKLLEELKI